MTNKSKSHFTHLSLFARISAEMLRQWYLFLIRLSSNSNFFQADKVKVTFELLKNYIWFASGQKKPSDNVIGEKQKPIGKLLEEISEMKESKRNTPFFNHLSAVAEGINAISWINVVSI